MIAEAAALPRLCPPRPEIRAQSAQGHGRAWVMVEVPVLSERVRAGTEIEPHDISWRRVRADRVRRQTISDIGELVGMSPKRHIADQPPGPRLRPADPGDGLEGRGGHHGVPSWRHDAHRIGPRVEDGARNKMIRVINDRSRLTIEARVEGPGRVNVVPASTFRQLYPLNQPEPPPAQTAD